MLKRATITTTLTTITENGDDIIRTASTGGVRIEDDALMLQFSEPENEGRATLLITSAIADLKRSGTVTSRMTFIEGRIVDCLYRMKEGSLPLSIFTHRTVHTVQAGGGRFEATYSVLSEGRHLADNTLLVEFRFTD